MTLDEQLAALPTLGLEELRAVWRERFGPPPKLRSPEALRWVIAWRLQAAVYGDLDPAARRLVRAKRRPAPPIAAGARLAREWKGVVHEVEAAGSGFVYDGRLFASLLEVARSITGVRWNRPRFFSLRNGQS